MTDAEGYEVGGEFVVCAESKGRLKDTASFHQSLRQKRLGLIDQQVLQVEGEQYVFVQDYAFQSPSTAAGVTLGRNANGRIEWKDAEGRTLKALQEMHHQKASG